MSFVPSCSTSSCHERPVTDSVCNFGGLIRHSKLRVVLMAIVLELGNVAVVIDVNLFGCVLNNQVTIHGLPSCMAQLLFVNRLALIRG